MGKIRGKIDVLPDTSACHDLRHYLASPLITSGAHINAVHALMRDRRADAD